MNMTEAELNLTIISIITMIILLWLAVWTSPSTTTSNKLIDKIINAKKGDTIYHDEENSIGEK